MILFKASITATCGLDVTGVDYDKYAAICKGCPMVYFDMQATPAFYKAYLLLIEST